MMKKLIILLFMSHILWATNGMKSIGFGNKNVAMGGAGVALHLDPMTMANNPAGLVEVEDSLSLGLEIFSPRRTFSTEDADLFGAGAPGREEDSDSNFFFIPHFAVKSDIIPGRLSTGIAIFGQGGMNTDYNKGPFENVQPPGSPGIDEHRGVDLAHLFITPTMSINLWKGVNFGFSPIIGLASFKSSSFQPDGNVNPGSNERNYAFGFGGQFGLQIEPIENLILGALYRTEVYFSGFNDYEDVFVASNGSINTPPLMAFGISYKIMDVTLAFDYERQFYTVVDTIGTSTLNGGFGWNDINAFKLGAAYDINENWTIRAGYNYGDSPISDGDVFANVLAPGVTQHHVTCGATLSFGNWEIDLTYMYAFNHTQRQNNQRLGAALNSQGTKIEMYQHNIGIGLVWKFGVVNKEEVKDEL
ncbi:OmpP1/FadL family transporter [Candidatus Uabimicrobium sp. HlEnr_7]|uniref:OmpP1/FadL family transporter n=1 Tax=Candidatus Uabimicrobium helgolandensis TaxID=3095367 RepID=UPI003556A68E